MLNWEVLKNFQGFENSNNVNHLSVYENHILQTFKSKFPVSYIPIISFNKSEEYYCVSVDENLYVFSTEDNELLLSKTYQSKIACFCVYKSIVVVVLNDGHIYGISISPKESLVFVESIKNGGTSENDETEPSFMSLLYYRINDVDSFFLLSKFGVIYQITIPDLDGLIQTVDNEQCYIASHTKTNLKITFKTVEILGSEIFFHGENLVKVCLNDFHEEEIMFHDSVFQIIKLLKPPKGNYLLAITKTGCLISICTDTYNMCIIWKNEFVEDFVFIDTESDRPCLALFTRNANGKQIVLYDYQKSHEVYRQNVDDFICFINSTKHEILYVESRENFAYLQIKLITKNLAELKLNRYIQLKQYEKAIEFAEKFQLNVESVYKAQIENMVKSISSEQNVNFEEFSKKFLYCINNIQDTEFICTYCIQVMPYDLNFCQELLSIAHKHLIVYLETNDCTEKISELMMLVNDVDIRLKLYIKINGETERHWKSFLQTDITKILMNYLKTKKIKYAILVFKDTKHILLKRNPENTVKTLLETTPNCLVLDDILPWYQHLIPTALQYNPSVIDDIISMVYNKLILFEKSRYEDWPHIGIEFTKEIIKMFDYNQVNVDNLYNPSITSINQSVSWNKLLGLLKALQLAFELKTNHNIFLPLDICLDENPEIIAAKILDRCQTESISTLFANFLRKFASQSQFDCDVFLINYIREIQKTYLKTNTELNKKENDCSRWEDFTMMLIKQISDPRLFSDSVVNLFKISTVPWSEAITAFFHEIKKVSNPSLSEQLNNIYLCNDIQQILEKYKYKLNLSYIKADAMQLIQRIVKLGQLNEIIRDVSVVVNSFKINDSHQMIVVFHFLKQDTLLYLTEYLNSLSNENALRLCYDILDIMGSMLNNQNEMNAINKSLSSHIYNALPLIQRHIEKLEDSNKTSYKSYIKNLKNIYKLRVDFNLQITPENFNQKNYRFSLLQQLINNNTDVLDTSERLLSLASLLNFSKEEMVHHIMSLVPPKTSLDLVLNLINEDIDEMTEERSIFYHRIAIMLMTLKIDKKDENIITSYDSMNKYLNVIVQLISSTSFVSNNFNELHYWGFIFDATRPSFTSTKDVNMQRDFLSKWRYTPIYRDVIVSTNFLPIDVSVKKCFECFLGISSIVKSTETKQALNFPEFNLDMINNLLQQLLHSIKKLKTFECHVILLHIITTFCNLKYSDNISMLPGASTVFVKMQKLAFELISSILSKIVLKEKFDSKLTFSLLLTMNPNDAKNWFISTAQHYKSDLKKLQFIHQIYLTYCSIREPKNQAAIKHAEKLNIQTIWARKLSDANLEYFNVLDADLSDLTNQMISNGSFNLIINFITDFKLDRIDVLLQYFDTIFLNWNPKNDYIENITSETAESYIQSLFEKSLQVISVINNSSIIAQRLNLIREKINVYNYEAYICMLKIQKHLGFNSSYHKYDILMLLSTYKRVNPPKESEKKVWNCESELEKITELANYRIPMNVLFSSNAVEMIKYEVNINNYHLWETVIDKLKIDRHKFYVFIIKDTVRGVEWQNVEHNCKWSLFPKNSKLLYQIEEIAQKITDWKTSLGSLFYVVNNTPPGADQMEAARLCYNYLQKNKNEEDTFCTQKVVEKYIEISMKHILYSNRLESYIKDHIEPQTLLKTLYQDKCIFEQVTSPQINNPNINKVAQQICALFNIDFNSFCFSFVNELLQKSDIMLDIEDTMNITTNFLNRNSERKENSLQIVCYILKSECISEENAIMYLFNIAFNDNMDDLEETTMGNITFSLNFSINSKSNTGTKLRALICLLSIADKEMLNQITKFDSIYIMSFMRELWFLDQLERLGIFFTIEKFKNCEIKTLIEGIWSENYHQPQAVAIIGALMFEYKIKSYNLWTQTIKQMIKFKMVKEIRYFLPRILDIISNHSTIYKSAAELLS